MKPARTAGEPFKPQGDALQSSVQLPIPARAAGGSVVIAFEVAMRATGVHNAGRFPILLS